MAVQVQTLDILTEQAGFEPRVARAIGDAIASEMNNSRESFATKQDLADGLASLKSELRGEINALREDMERNFKEVRKDFADLRKEFAELRQEFANSKADMARWMFTGFISTFLATLGAMYVMLQTLR